MPDVSRLGVFFNPKSVAIVGASSDPKKPGNTALKNLVSMGYKGKVFPINPREESILGFPCYKNMLDVPEPVELCVLLVPAESSVQVAKELAERKKRFNDVLGAVCMSAGFGELNTPEAKERETELARVLNAASIRLIGPNCLGTMDAYSGFNTNFDIPGYPRGALSFVTQSGAFANSFLFWAGGLRLTGLCKFASIGNMADVSMAELLALWKDDDSTRVIAIYLEGLRNPQEFFEVAREVTAIKPVVVLKSGRTEVGSTAALSHTGAVAGSDAIYDGAFKQAGMIRAKNVSEFYDTLRAFEKQPLPEGNRVSVLTHMGGPGTICVDEISVTPTLQLAKFSPGTHSALKAACAPMANVGNPDGYIDMTAAHFEKLHNQVLQLLFQDKNIDLVMQIVAPSAFIDQKLIVEEIVKAYESQTGKRKPFLNAVTFGRFALETRQGLEDAGLPTVEFPDSLARVAENMVRYAEYRRSASARARERTAAQTGKQAESPAAKLIATAVRRGRIRLVASEAYRVCRQYGIKAPPFRLAGTIEDALDAANKIGYPVELKIDPAGFLPETGAGRVMPGVDSDSLLKRSYRKLVADIKKAAPQVQQIRVLVRKVMPAALELAMGGIRDKLFGPAVMFGLGGIYNEALKIVGFRLAPLGIQDARDLIYEILPAALIQSTRGGRPINVESIAQALVSLGRLLIEQPQVERVDLNPVIPHESGCMAIDAQVVVSSKKQ